MPQPRSKAIDVWDKFIASEAQSKVVKPKGKGWLTAIELSAKTGKTIHSVRKMVRLSRDRLERFRGYNLGHDGKVVRTIYYRPKT